MPVRGARKAPIAFGEYYVGFMSYDSASGGRSACSGHGRGVVALWCHSRCRHHEQWPIWLFVFHPWKRESPLLTLTARHEGFSEANGGLRWVPPGVSKTW